MSCAWNEDPDNVEGKDFKLFSDLNDAFADRPPRNPEHLKTPSEIFPYAGRAQVVRLQLRPAGQFQA